MHCGVEVTESSTNKQHHLSEDTGLDLNDKTIILVKGISAAEAHAAAQRLLAADPSLAHILLQGLRSRRLHYIGLGVPIGTDAFVQHFVKAKCLEIMEDVDKLDNLQDCFIHYQLVRFCQATRLQYLNRSSLPTSRCSNNGTLPTRSPMHS